MIWIGAVSGESAWGGGGGGGVHKRGLPLSLEGYRGLPLKRKMTGQWRCKEVHSEAISKQLLHFRWRTFCDFLWTN